VLAAGAPIYVCAPGGRLSLVFGHAFEAVGWQLRQTLVWVRDSIVLGRSDYHYRHEQILYGYKPGEGRRGRGGVGWYGDPQEIHESWRVTVPDGTVFIAVTERPTVRPRRDYDMLSRRATRNHTDLEVELMWWKEPCPVRPIELSEAERASWLAEERERVLRPLAEGSETARMPGLALSFMGEPRSQADYRREVDAYLARAETALISKARAHQRSPVHPSRTAPKAADGQCGVPSLPPHADVSA
jgi:hypothetical protein